MRPQKLRNQLQYRDRSLIFANACPGGNMRFWPEMTGKTGAYVIGWSITGRRRHKMPIDENRLHHPKVSLLSSWGSSYIRPIVFRLTSNFCQLILYEVKNQVVPQLSLVQWGLIYSHALPRLQYYSSMGIKKLPSQNYMSAPTFTMVSNLTTLCMSKNAAKHKNV